MINQDKSPFVLPPLPYEQNALEPFISDRTLSFHHGKHHNTYVINLNNLIVNTEFSTMSLEQIILASAKRPEHTAIFNNAAQVWNHTFLWHCMCKNGGGIPTGSLKNQIDKDFGSFDGFVDNFKKAGVGQFGSGWIWLVWDGARLKVTKTSNADLPLLHNEIALLTTDVWEHAYYLDYQNRRPDYLTVFIDKLVNWGFAQNNFDNISQ